MISQGQPAACDQGWVLNGKFMTPDDVKKLADLESREVLLAKVAGALQGVLQQAISLVSAPLSQAARVFAALEQAAGENPSLLAPRPRRARSRRTRSWPLSRPGSGPTRNLLPRRLGSRRTKNSPPRRHKTQRSCT